MLTLSTSSADNILQQVICGLETRFSACSWCIKLKDLWLQGGGFDPWTRKHVNNVWGSEVKWHKPARSIMIHISEVYSSVPIHVLPRAIRARGDDCPQAVSCDSELTLFTARSQVLFHSIFGAGCSMVSWLIVILINGWQWLDSCPNTGSIASPSPQPALLPSSSGTGRGLSMKFSSHSSVYTLQPLPDPVNVLSVSWHTCSLNNDPGVKSCTNNEPCPLPLNNPQRVNNQMINSHIFRLRDSHANSFC